MPRSSPESLFTSTVELQGWGLSSESSVGFRRLGVERGLVTPRLG